MATPNETLQGLEAEARSAYAECAAGTCDCGLPGGRYGMAHAPQEAPAAYAITDVDGVFIIVGYDGRAPMGGEQWQYMFSTHRDYALRGKFDCRYSCLLTLAARMEVAS